MVSVRTSSLADPSVQTLELQKTFHKVQGTGWVLR